MPLKGLMCILSSFTVFSVGTSNPMVDIRVLALMTDFLEIMVKTGNL